MLDINDNTGRGLRIPKMCPANQWSPDGIRCIPKPPSGGKLIDTDKRDAKKRAKRFGVILLLAIFVPYTLGYITHKK
tara:strand:- start:522 stop:752 length:231 start_codon:yes stop_codon:yes gene_type:complete